MNEKSEVLKRVGQNIKQARMLKGITQEVLSERINKSTNFISLIERGESGVSLSTLVDICNVLQIDSKIIFNGLIIESDTTEAKGLINSLAMFEEEDKAIVVDLVKYILNSKK